MSIHYKFKTALDYSTLSFCGDSISIADLKREIIREKQLTLCDIQITNADTKQVYCNESSFIPSETSVIITRTPLSTTSSSSSSSVSLATTNSSRDAKVENTISQQYQRNGASSIFISTPIPSSINHNIIVGDHDRNNVNFFNSSSSSSTQNQYTRPIPSNYCCVKCKIPGHWVQDCPYYPKKSQFEFKLAVKRNQEEEVVHSPSSSSSSSSDEKKRRIPPNYLCNRCGRPGHWIQDCVLSSLTDRKIKSTGIPRSFMVPAMTPSVPGALVTPDGQIVVPAVNQEAYKGKNFRHEHHHIAGQYNELNYNKKPRIE